MIANCYYEAHVEVTIQTPQKCSHQSQIEHMLWVYVKCVLYVITVIVMTFWYILGMDLTFSNFLNFYFHLGLVMTPHVLYVHITYVYSFSYVFLFT